ncbi:MAG TPA: hypothetical protein PLR41_05550 [Alphaproteobacteria bacterium]|nr:hypothetical protein [Alphaproteobacteria bacterium]
MRVKRLWQWLLGLGVVAAALCALGYFQGGAMAAWLGDSGGAPAEWAASLAYDIAPLQRRAAQAAADAEAGHPVRLGSVAATDLDRDGNATDLVISYFDCDAAAECGPSFLVAKGIGFTHRAAGAFAQVSALRPVGGLLIGDLRANDLSNGDPPASVVLGWQGGKLIELGRFARKPAGGGDGAIETFDPVPTPRGLRLRTPDGLVDIAWDDAAQRYQVAMLDWKAVAAPGQHVLFVQRPDGALAVDTRLMLDDQEVAGSRDAARGITLRIAPRDRIIYDARCQALGGFQAVPDALGAVTLDPAAAEHAFACTLYPGAVVKVRVETGA